MGKQWVAKRSRWSLDPIRVINGFSCGRLRRKVVRSSLRQGVAELGLVFEAAPGFGVGIGFPVGFDEFVIGVVVVGDVLGEEAFGFFFEAFVADLLFMIAFLLLEFDEAAAVFERDAEGTANALDGVAGGGGGLGVGVVEKPLVEDELKEFELLAGGGGVWGGDGGGVGDGLGRHGVGLLDEQGWTGWAGRADDREISKQERGCGVIQWLWNLMILAILFGVMWAVIAFFMRAWATILTIGEMERELKLLREDVKRLAKEREAEQ